MNVTWRETTRVMFRLKCLTLQMLSVRALGYQTANEAFAPWWGRSQQRNSNLTRKVPNLPLSMVKKKNTCDICSEQLRNLALFWKLANLTVEVKSTNLASRIGFIQGTCVWCNQSRITNAQNTRQTQKPTKTLDSTLWAHCVRLAGD